MISISNRWNCGIRYCIVRAPSGFRLFAAGQGGPQETGKQRREDPLRRFITDLERRDILFVLLFLLVIWQRAALFDYFVMPNPDYLNQLDVVGWLKAREMTGDFKIAPVYPFLILLLGSVVQGSPPDIYRIPAELLNLVFFLGSVLLLWRLGRRFLGRAGIFLPLFFFLHPQTSGELAGQPLIEEWLLFTILLGFFLGMKRSRLAVPAAFLACLSRYEGVFLVPALLIRDAFAGELRRTGGFARAFARAGLAVSGLAIWITLSLFLSGTVNPYVQDILPEDSSVWNFPLLLAFSVIRPLVSNWIFIEGEGTSLVAMSSSEVFGPAVFIILSVLFWATTVAGGVSLLKNRRSEAAALILFFILFTCMHCVYAVPLEKHVYPVLWIVYLFFIAGAGSCARIAGEKSKQLLFGAAVPVTLLCLFITISPEPPAFPAADRMTIVPAVENDPVPALGIHSAGEHPGTPVKILEPPFTRGDGARYMIDLPGYLAGDILDDGSRSAVIMFEDGVPLPFGHALHADIRDKGGGRYSLWQSEDGTARLNFSTPDNTDPNTNGRTYSVAGRAEFEGSVLLDISVPEGVERAASLYFEAAASGESPAAVRAVLSAEGIALEKRLISLPESRFTPVTFSFREYNGNHREGENLTLLLEPIEGSVVLDQFSLEIPQRFPYAIFTILLCILSFAALLPVFVEPALIDDPDGSKLAGISSTVSAGRTVLYLILGLFMAGISARSVSDWKRFHDHFAFNYGQQYLVGRWYAENAEPGDRLLMCNQHIANYSSGLASEYFETDLTPFPGQEPASILQDLRDRGVTYIVWDSDEPEPWMERDAGLRRFPYSEYGDLVKEIRAGNRIAAIYRIPPTDIQLEL